MKRLFHFLPLALWCLAASAQSKTHEQQLNDEYCSGLFKTTDGTILDITSDISVKSYFNILDWLQGRVAGLQIRQTRTGVKFPIIRGNLAGLYLDEMPVSYSLLNSVSVNDIAIIKVIKTPFYGGFNAAGGAIAIYTRCGDDEKTAK